MSFCLSRIIAIGIPLCITKPELMSIWYYGGVWLVAVFVSAIVRTNNSGHQSMVQSVVHLDYQHL